MKVGVTIDLLGDVNCLSRLFNCFAKIVARLYDYLAHIHESLSTVTSYIVNLCLSLL